MAWIRLFAVALLLCCNLAHAVVRVGIAFYYPPFVVSKIEGFDVDLINAICTKISQGCTLYPIEFGKLYDALDAGKVDIIIGGLTIPILGTSNYVYSRPYKITEAQFVALASDSIKTIDDLKGKKIGTIKPSGDADYLVEKYSGLMQPVFYSGMTYLINGLASGEVRGIFIDDAVIRYWSAQLTGRFLVLGQPILTGSGYAIVGTQNSRELINQINGLLIDINNDGEFSKMYNAYFNL